MAARIGYQSILIALLLGLAAALFLALLPRLHEQVIVRAGDIGLLLAEGETAQIRSFYGFNEVETADGTRFRWTDGIGNFVVRSGERLGEPLIVQMRLCGCRGGKSAVSRLLLRVNGITLADATALAAAAQWRRYALLAPPIDTAYSPDLLVELSSDTIKNPQFGYRMGVALDSITILPATRQRAYSPASALALGLSIGALALVTWTKDEGRRTNIGAVRELPLRRASSMVRTAALGLALVALQGVFYRHNTLPIEIPAFGLILSLGLALRANAPPATTIVVALLLSALVVLPQVLGTWMLDDAYISFRYARNALMSHGFVFNPGERVEGYTNFLWTVLFVPILGAGLNPALVSQIITLLLALATAALTWGSARRMGGTVPATAALALLATSTPFILYAARGSGMETALFTLLVLGAVLAYLTTDHRPPTIHHPIGDRGPRTEDRGSRIEDSDPRSSILQVIFVSRRSMLVGALLALAAMTRPEGILVAAVCGLQLLVTSWRGGQVALRRLLDLGVGFLAIFGPYYLWRFSYYGYLLPNTFYAKVGGTSAQALRGLGYAAEFARSQAPLLIIALIGIPLAYLATADDRPPTNRSRMEDRGSPSSILDPRSSILDPPSSSSDSPILGRRSSVVGRRSSFLWLLLIIYTLYIVAVGGDHFPFYRFFVPLLPPLALLAALGFGQLGRALPRQAIAPALALIAAAGVGWQIPQLYASRTLNADGRVWSENSVVEKNREIGLWLRAHTPPDTLIATGIAGALPFYAERPVLDTLGLNDLHIAHLDVPTIGQGVAGAEKTDNDYILRRAPAYVPYSSAGALLEDPRFLQLYDRGIVHGPEGRWLRLYKRADIAPPETWTPIEDQ